MAVCNAHSKLGTAGLMEALDENFLNVEKNTIQSEVSKSNSIRILRHQSAAEFVDGVDSQAKVLENLDREVTDE